MVISMVISVISLVIPVISVISDNRRTHDIIIITFKPLTNFIKLLIRIKVMWNKLLI